jgi:hypothetical protein
MADLPPPPFQPGDRIPPSRGEQNGIAISAFILGVVSVPFFLFVIPAALAVVFGVIGYRRAFYFGAPHRGLAGWGLALGIGSLALFLIIGFSYTGDL